MNPLFRPAEKVEKFFIRKGICLTLGGEPSYVPIEPIGGEWSITAVGPTKLDYAYKMARALIADVVPNGVVFYSPGKSYPGEVNPRWALHLVWRRDLQPFGGKAPKVVKKKTASLEALMSAICKQCKIADHWLRGEGGVAVLPIDFQNGRWVSEAWPFAKTKLPLTAAAGPAGLRLPLQELPSNALRRALVLEPKGEALHVFLPPVLQAAFVEIFAIISSAALAAGFSEPVYEGYVPSDEAGDWQKLSLTPDPGVLEINLPPCPEWKDYHHWLGALERAATATGMRSHKVNYDGSQGGTGGGNHLLFGGPSFEEHPFFTRPQWLASIVRYWQHHPALSYLFTGSLRGSFLAGAAPR
ncbi:MAG: transglutaminase family protein [Chthoniobacteraceae bacterium]